jgi:LysR family glycine cleavage system transcriptional activator
MRLPSLNALRAFEAAARHESFARAASELCVSEGAVSRHVKLLEEELGVPLFRRLVRRVELTDRGRQLMGVVSQAFASIAEGTARIGAGRTDLKIIAAHTPSIRWLVPRLERFRRRGDDFQLQLVTRMWEWDEFLTGDYDLALSCGRMPDEPYRKQLRCERLMPATLTPLCTPRMAAALALTHPRQLAEADLVHSSEDYYDWQSWTRTCGLEDLDIARGQIYPNRDMAVQAAVLGEGIAIGELAFVQEELATGKLVVPFPHLIHRSERDDYYIVGRTEVWHDPRVEAFYRWIIEERAGERPSLAAE